MTAANRPAARADCGCDLSVGPNAVHIVDGHPDPRPSVTDNARAEAQRRWPGALGGKDAVPRRAFIAGAEWAAARAETTTGAIARGEALAAGDPNWMNVTRWPRTEAEATATILRLIEDNRRMRHGSLCPECNAKAWGERADFRRERDELAARLAAVEALLPFWERKDRVMADGSILASEVRAALSTAPTDTTKETP